MRVWGENEGEMVVGEFRVEEGGEQGDADEVGLGGGVEPLWLG